MQLKFLKRVFSWAVLIQDLASDGKWNRGVIVKVSITSIHVVLSMSRDFI